MLKAAPHRFHCELPLSFEANHATGNYGSVAPWQIQFVHGLLMKAG
jgi:hypothetical protein